MDLSNPRPLTVEDFKEYFRLVINTHTSSTYTILDNNNYEIAVEGVGKYNVAFNKPSTFTFIDIRGREKTKHLPYDITVTERNGGVREKIIQRVLYDLNNFCKEVIVKVL